MRTRIQLALGVAVCVAAIVIGVVIWIDRMDPVTIQIASATPDMMQVEVRGAVNTPGVVQVPVGSRLQHVVDAAGGFLPDADLSVLNLAGRIGDGERIDIPSQSDPSGGQESDEPTADLIDINTATASELETLPGIGGVLSERIVAYREEHGPFASVEELQYVDGISPRLVDELRPFIVVSDGQ